MAMMTLFQVITLEGWTNIMYSLMDASIPAIPIIFFTLLVLMGAFFLLNLILAVIMQEFDSVDRSLM